MNIDPYNTANFFLFYLRATQKKVTSLQDV